MARRRSPPPVPQHPPGPPTSPRPHAPTTTPQLPTKRDVRRQRILDRLQTMVRSFDAHQHQHYRAQLQAVQVDMTLVLRADLHARQHLLDDGGADVRHAVQELAVVLPEDEQARRDFGAMAGGRYRRFAREVNDCAEMRDAELTALYNQYTESAHELERSTQGKLHLAEEEYKALSNTVRQRLIATLTKKRQHLARDKEQLDIADSNALLLHPNHFSINIPSSPGGLAANRKTRHLRHRAASPALGEPDTNGKRKRKAAAAVDDDDNNTESPVPAFKPLPPPDMLGGARSPFKDARDKTAYTQFDAPAYSLERIFTDKELALATDTARTATWRYFHRPDPSTTTTTTNGLAPASLDADPAAPTTDSPTPPAAAPDTDRSSSHHHHHHVLTRGTARANPLAALSELAAAATAREPFAPALPSAHAVTRSEKSSAAPAPAGLPADSADRDLDMMRELRGDAEAAAPRRRELLDRALGAEVAGPPFRAAVVETGPAQIGRGVERAVASGFAEVLVERAGSASSASEREGSGERGGGRGRGRRLV